MFPSRLLTLENVTVKALEQVVEQVFCQKIPDLVAPVCEASTSEVYLRMRNRKSHILCGIVESENEQDLALLLNQTLLPAHSSSEILHRICLPVGPGAFGR